ncbi:hypothetical protein FD723_34610 (plasmid) [Nostoc sp. C052]|uniref:hypothetical protein n=1 Tax=Nostoc sp. C052 TaxID=2576902 RepID=UPI0015C3E928|nr:hypothetical protein [Nostoc sp. C052]QLE45450.1 hypothetical protein FD723_34610 [Nostoc sp. C052]
MTNASLKQQSDVSGVVKVRWISLGITCQIVGRRTGTCAFNSLETIPLSKTNSPRTGIFLGKLAVINHEHQLGTYQNRIQSSVIKPIRFFAICDLNKMYKVWKDKLDIHFWMVLLENLSKIFFKSHNRSEFTMNE